jgi:hypothetical protein
LGAEVEGDEIVAELPQYLTPAFILPEKKSAFSSGLSNLAKGMHAQASRHENLIHPAFGFHPPWKVKETPKEEPCLPQGLGESATGVVDAEFTEPEPQSGVTKSEGLDLEHLSSLRSQATASKVHFLDKQAGVPLCLQR